MASKRDRVPPLLRAFGLLEHIARANGPVGLQELAADAGLPKPTVYRMISTLEDAGLATREPDGRRIAAGPRLVRFALDVQLSETVRAPRHAILKRLAETLGETVNLTMLDGSEVVYLDRVETAAPLRFYLQPGSRVPVHCSASGKILLGQFSAAERARMLRHAPLSEYTQKTITDFDRLQAEIDHAREDGYAIDDEEFLPGLVCIAVLVPAADGARSNLCVAAQAPVMRLTAAKAPQLLPALRRAADALSRIESDAADASGPAANRQQQLSAA